MEKENNDNRPSYMKKRVIIPSITAILLILLGLYFVIHSLHFQSTDDAFVEGHIVSIAAQVSGPVKSVLIDDNQPVKKGDLLVEIDPADYDVKLLRSKAKLKETIATLNVSDKEIIKAKSNLEDAKLRIIYTKDELDFANNDFNRYSEMYKEGIVSKQDYEKSKTNKTDKETHYQSALQKEKSAQADLASKISTKEATKAKIKSLEAEVKKDELSLSYTKIYAPQDGLITNRSVEKGNFLQIGQPVFSIVPEKVWIIANFKETQLTNIKIGQKVKIKIDTYPNKRFTGRVDSIQRATGAKASLFPPENAVGSYVKIVQRIPVKITFEDDISKYNIVPGMSVVPEIKVK